MAQSNNKYGFWPASGRHARITYLPVKASQTLAVGDAVILSSNQVAIALYDSAELCGVMAQPAASLDAGTMVAVYADPDTYFEAIADADSSSVEPGDKIDIVGGTGAMMLDADATSTNVMCVLRGNVEDTDSSAYARWLVKIDLHAFADVSS